MKKYSVSIIGAGNISAFYDTPSSRNISTHAHSIELNGKVFLSGFYDVAVEKAKKASKIWGGKVFASIEEAVSMSEIVYICVPDCYHAEVLLEVLKYQTLAIVTEKPLTLSIDDAIKVKEVATKSGTPIFLNYTRRYVNEFRELRDYINTEKVGRFRKGVGYYGKGVLHNGSHMIDLLSFLLKDDMTVISSYNPIIDNDEKDPSADVVLRIGEGTFSLLAMDCRYVTIFELDLLFENQRIRILDNGKIIEYYEVKKSEQFAGYENYCLKEIKHTSWMPVVSGLIDNVVNYIEKRDSILCGIDEGIHILKVNDMIKKELEKDE